jgi:serine/threonine protein kinase
MGNRYCQNCWQQVEAADMFCGKCMYPKPESGWLDHHPKGRELQGGKYRFVSPLGAGGFGCRAKALEFLDNGFQRPVAINCFLFNEGQKNQASFNIRDFLEEAASLRKLNHPNLVALYDTFYEDDIPYLVMEFVDAGTLLDMNHQIFPEDLSLFFPLFIQISDAIAQLHAKGILHCDLKPSNIGLLDNMGRVNNFVKILDFGLAVNWKKSIGWIGENLGTLGFAAPEQLAGNPSPKSDVFSFGVMMYLMLSKRLPYHPDRFINHNSIKLPSPEPLTEVPTELAKLIETCISPDPDHRPAMPTRRLQEIAVYHHSISRKN